MIDLIFIQKNCQDTDNVMPAELFISILRRFYIFIVTFPHSLHYYQPSAQILCFLPPPHPDWLWPTKPPI